MPPVRLRHILLLVIALLLAGCGGNEAAPAGEEPTAPALPTATILSLGDLEQTVAAPTTEPPPATDPPPPAADTPAPEPTIAPAGTPTPEPAATPGPPAINGIPPEQFVVIPPEVAANIRTIYAQGQALGRNPNYFSKLGDSTTLNPNLLGRFDDPELNLGDYAFLQPTVDQYAGAFAQFGVAARLGLHSWSVFDPLWADKDWCNNNETVLECEFRLNNPSILIVRLGSNDSGFPEGFDFNMRKVVQYAIDNGVIPIVATKADRFEGEDNINNILLRQIAADLQVPLWDFDLVAATLPGRGLNTDLIHMIDYPPNDFRDPAIFQSGHAMQDLSGLMVLDAIRQILLGE